MTTTLINSPDDMQWLADAHLTDLNISWKPRSAIINGNEDCPDTIELYPRKDPLYTDLPLRGVLIGDRYEFCGPLTAQDALAIEAIENQREHDNN